MANPQKENGYIAIATEIMEQLIQLSLSGSEWQVLLAVLRQTWGWQKKQDWISLTQFERLTKLPHRTVCRAKKKLVSKKTLLTRNNLIKFNKNYEDWVVSKKTRVVSKVALGSVKSGTQAVSKVAHTITTKEITTNTIDSKPRRKAAPLSDEEFLSLLKTNPAYSHINMGIELAKMDAWLMVHSGRKKTRRFIVNWLNKIDKPLVIPKQWKNP